MKVLFLHRSKSFGGFSFEELFKTIKEHLTDCQVIEYYDKTAPSFWKNIKAIKKIECDVIHITGGIGYYALFLPTHKTTLTVHDTNHYEFDLKGIKKWLYGWLIYRLPIKNVRYVTVVSEHTKNNLMCFFNVPEQKIKVISNCYPASFTKASLPEKSSPFKILQIGTKANKNIKRLASAIQNEDIELTIVGKMNESLKTDLEAKQINYVNKFDLSRKEIYNEYVNTDLVAFVSLREGFGLPIIEANSIGRPVISSNISSMPEVAQDAALLIDPTSEEQIKQGIRKLMNDPALRGDLVQKGIKNAQRFHPSEIAKQYRTLYAEISQAN